jgi:hypothetical protein
VLHAWNTADHVSRFPFQIFQTPQAVALVFEWSLVYRLIYMNGTPHSDNIDSWMGDSRGRREGDTLIVDVTNQMTKPGSIWPGIFTVTRSVWWSDTT